VRPSSTFPPNSRAFGGHLIAHALSASTWTSRQLPDPRTRPPRLPFPVPDVHVVALPSLSRPFFLYIPSVSRPPLFTRHSAGFRSLSPDYSIIFPARPDTRRGSHVVRPGSVLSLRERSCAMSPISRTVSARYFPRAEGHVQLIVSLAPPAHAPAPCPKDARDRRAPATNSTRGVPCTRAAVSQPVCTAYGIGHAQLKLERCRVATRLYSSVEGPAGTSAAERVRRLPIPQSRELASMPTAAIRSLPKQPSPAWSKAGTARHDSEAKGALKLSGMTPPPKRQR